jgi:hypothetical protein
MNAGLFKLWVTCQKLKTFLSLERPSRIGRKDASPCPAAARRKKAKRVFFEWP